ncbi:serine/threonine-protein kinase atr [Diachasma alloeum]|uniref:serine/threonine-protein kinase atr n=1 Tax=Diachasma alloeum TaxID=454923 RepID=UPI000738509B|nr:serine/threonine-protein kinase atr [Diachasma alloeum]
MDMDESDSPEIQQRIAVAESLWGVINTPAIKIFSLKKSESEPSLRAFLELLNRAAENFINILIPPFKSSPRYDPLKSQYSAFTRWLFGVLFHVIGDPLNPQVLLNSLEVQACMLRILSRLHLPEFFRITQEYLAILDDTLDFESDPRKSQIIIKQFVVEPNSIEKLDLTHFPVTITRESIVTTQISIMKIIIKSGVSSWDLEDLWKRTLKIMIKCKLESKVISMELISQLLTFSSLDDDKVQMFVSLCVEVVRSLNTLNPNKSPDNVNFNVINRTPTILKDLLTNLKNTSQVVDLCFAVVEATTSGRISSKELEYSAIDKIRNHLIRHPRSASPLEDENLLKWHEKSSKFSIIIAHFIIYQLNTSSRAGKLIAANTSPLWRSIQALMLQKIETKELPELRKCLEIGRTISLWMMSKKIRGKLFDDSEALMASLRGLLENSQDSMEIELSYLCLMELMMIGEFPKAEVQKILLLPWFPDKSSSNLDLSRRLSTSLKTLTMETKLKCLETICEFGKGRVRIKYLSTCVSNNDSELSVSAVRNSVLLLTDPEASFNDINLHVLRPAVVGQRVALQEAVARVLGDIICLLSGKAQLIRPEWDSLTWSINCNVCVKHFEHSSGLSDKFPIDESIFTSYFSLFSSNVLSVRRAMSKNLVKLSNHLQSFSSNAVCKTWLALINDPDVEIRSNLSNSIAKLARNKLKSIFGGRKSIQDDTPKDLKDFVELVIDHLGDGLTVALERPNEPLQMSLVNTAKEFARAEIYSAERRICAIFIITIMHPESSYTAMASATVAYKEVAGYCKLTPYKLFLRYRKDFVELMTQLLANNFVEKSHSVAMSLSKIVHCIGYSGAREFMRKAGSLVVSHLVPMVIKVPRVRDMFKEIADLLALEEREMFVEYFQQICPHFFLNETPEVGSECLDLVSKLARVSARDLMKISFIGIFRKLLLHFHDKMERVLICLEVISEFDADHKGNFETNQSIANYLKPHLHAVLVKFDTNLGPMSDEGTQKSALGSLGALMKFMGATHLSPLRYKILTTLRTCLNLTRPGFKKLSCYAWDCFLRNVSLEDLGPLLPTICVSMVPLLDSCPQEANAMMEFLLIDNNEALQSHISELFFIDDLKVNKRISSVVANQVARSTPRDPEAGLKIWIRRIKHETDEVRSKALSHLKKFLEVHRSHLNDMILSNTDVHPLVVDLLDSLLAGCQDKDESIRLKCGECLGQLGAVEPSLLPRRIVSKDDSKFIPEMNEDFALEVLQELVRALQMEKITQNVDCFSLAIQEILKTFEISPTGSNSRIWNSLSPTTQERILPLLNSRYKHTATDPDTVESPVYGSSAGSTFEKWLYNWTCSMILTIKDPKLFSVLSACQPALRRDSRTTMFCIPHIFTHIIMKGSDTDRNRLLTEIFAVIKSGDQTLDQELVIRRPLRRETNDKKSDTRVSDEARRIRCSQVVFSTLDHVMRWLGEKRREKDQKYLLMQRFVDQLDSFVLAEACYKSHEYHRALMYLERHMTSKNKGLSDQTESGLLAKIYTQLEEPDGVSGILATQDQSPTLQQLVVAHEVTGQLQDAAICYEKLAQRLVSPKFIQGMIHCYLGLDQPFTAMKFTEGVLGSSPELEPLMVEHEPFWRLANFVQLNDDKNSVKRDLLEDLKRGVQPDLQGIKKRLVTLLGATSHRVSYLQQSYPYIMKLHILNEFEKATDLMLKNVESLPIILKEWEQREQLIRASRGVESVLGMRRATLDLFVQLTESNQLTTDVSNLKQEIGKIWLKSAKIARKSGLYQQAYMYILSASDFCPPQELNIELAQLYWQRNSQEDALITLKRSFTNCFQSLDYYQKLQLHTCPPDRKNFAKAKLLFARYNEETLNVDKTTNMKYYEESYSAWKSWGKSSLALAQYQESFIEAQAGQPNGSLLGKIINYYGRSLQFSCKYVHQSMPRMLTIWMDFAEKVHTSERPQKEQVEMVEKMTKIIDAYCTRLPTYVWLTALSQLISRISHPSKDVQEQLIKILVKLMAAHPQYCMWMMACVLNSKKSPLTSVLGSDKRPLSFKDRIWNHKSLQEPTIKKIMTSFRLLWEKLIEFTAFRIEGGVSRTKVSILCKDLPKLLKNPSFGSIMMPTTQFFRLSLPADGALPDGYDPLSNDRISIVGIEEEVTVMTSAQKPKKIMLRGSDGKRYSFMCKPDDDLRRDFRLMEFNGIVNKYLQKDPESRQRRLYIRTYSVVPLHEKCGIIEWVQNLLPFRQALLGIYKERKLGMSGEELRRLAPPLRTDLEIKRKLFVEKLLPRHPPVLGDWFRLMFPDPYAWYEARTAYIRTTAVMSMVGYVLGLGDRHGENILFDCKCGDTVHVDFNCLFNTGETLKVPEKVPFRLTHNMVSAMGPLKYEGPFRKSCETTMRVLRTQARTLNSVLKPFVYTERVTTDAETNVRNIEQRLAGFVKLVDESMVKLSVKGQVNHLILDATSIDNLCQLYYGWGAQL